MSLEPHEVKSLIADVLAEQHRLQPDDIDKAVQKALTAILDSFGIDEGDRKELRADFIHLRKWRKSVDAATSLTFKVVVGTLVSGVLGALWLGFKALMGK